MKRTLFVIALFLMKVAACSAVFVKPIDCNIEVWPYNDEDTVEGIQNAIDNNSNFEDVKILPGEYWERVDIESLSSSRTQQVITGWIPGPNEQNPGHEATGEDAELIRIKAALRNPLMPYITDHYIYQSDQDLRGCRVFSNETAWTLCQGGNITDFCYTISPDYRTLFLYCSQQEVPASSIGIVLEGNLNFGLVIDVPNNTNSLHIKNLVVEYGKYGATMVRSPNSLGDVFDNVRFYNSCTSEIYFSESSISNLTFNNCKFIKHNIASSSQSQAHIAFSTGPDEGLTNYDFHNVSFIDCQFQIPFNSTTGKVYGFYKTIDYDKNQSEPGCDVDDFNRIYDIESLNFSNCSFFGNYACAVLIYPDWKSREQENVLIDFPRLRNVHMSDCVFTGNILSIQIFPPINGLDVTDCHFSDCQNGIDIRAYYPDIETEYCPDNPLGYQQQAAINADIFTDNIRIENNTFSRIGIYDQDQVASFVHNTASAYLPSHPLDQMSTIITAALADFKAKYTKQGDAIVISGEMTSLDVRDNTFSNIGRHALLLNNTNGEQPLSTDAVNIVENRVHRCLGSNLILNSSWMTVADNLITDPGTDNEHYREIDHYFNDLSDSLQSVYGVANINGVGEGEMTVAVGITILPAQTWRKTDCRNIIVENNQIIGSKAQGILTEGGFYARDAGVNPEYLRVSDVLIQGNRIWAKPHIFQSRTAWSQNNGQWTLENTAKVWPTLWISDTDNCQVRDNYFRGDHFSSWEGGLLFKNASIGVTIDGCTNVNVEDNHFHGLTEAFRLRVDNANGSLMSPNRPQNLNCTIRHNIFSGVGRGSDMGPFAGTHHWNSLLSFGYLHDFKNMPASPDVSFQGNLVEENLIQVNQQDGIMFRTGTAALTLNYPLVPWPLNLGETFFTNHNCVGQVDNEWDLESNSMSGNFVNILEIANSDNVVHDKILRISYGPVENSPCDDIGNHSASYSLSRASGTFPNSVIRDDNSWDCAFDEVASLAVPGLGEFPQLKPVLRVPEDFPNLQGAIDFAHAHPHFQPKIRISSAEISGPGNTDLLVPAGEYFIEAAQHCELNGNQQDGWFTLDPGATLTLSRFTLSNPGANPAGWVPTDGQLILDDCGLIGADSLLIAGLCRVQGGSVWQAVNVRLDGEGLVVATDSLDWQHVALSHPDPLTGTSLVQVEKSPKCDWTDVRIRGGAGDGAGFKDSDATLVDCVIDGGAGFGLVVETSQLHMQNCAVSEWGGAGISLTLDSRLKDLGSAIQECGIGLMLVGSTVGADLVGTTLEANVGDGLYAQATDLLDFRDLTVVGNGGTGLGLYNSDARLTGCLVQQNGQHGIKASHSRVDMSQFAANVIQGNSQTVLALDDAEPYLSCGHNTLTGALSCLVEGTAPVDDLWSFQFNYWGTTDPINRICIPNVTYQLYPVCEVPCLSGSECLLSGMPGTLLQQATQLEQLSQFVEARDRYQMIPEEWPSKEEATSALHGVYRCSLAGKLDMTAAQAYFLFIATRFPGTTLAKVAEDLAIRCKGVGGERMAAAGDFLALVQPGDADSLANLQKAVVMATEALLLGEASKDGGVDASGLPHFQNVKELTQWLRSGSGQATQTDENLESLPSSFELSSPWPNPFNPATQFMISLPSAAKVVVTIHNVMGQVVRQVVNQQLEPGRHVRQWDGRNAQGQDVASGVYILHVSTLDDGGKTRVDSKKMILLR